MHHYIDTLKFKEKVELLNIIYTKEDKNDVEADCNVLL